MNKESKELYREALEYFNTVQQRVKDLEQNTDSMTDLIDAIYAVREAQNFLDDVRKTFNSLSDFLQQVAYVRIASNHRKSFATEYASAKIGSKSLPSLPSLKHDPEALYALAEYFGIPREVAERDITRFHWPGIVEYTKELLEKGESFPIEVKETHKLCVNVRKKKGILEKDENSTEV